MQKKADFKIALVVILVSLAIVIATLVTFSVHQQKNKEAEIETRPFNLGAEIKSFDLINDNTAEVELERNSGEGEVSGIKFVFEDNSGGFFYYQVSNESIEKSQTKKFRIK